MTTAGPSPNDRLGFDLWIGEDMDPSGRNATGRELIINGALHRLTTDALLLAGAPDGYVEFGIDVRRWCGAAISQADASARGLLLVEVLQRDPRVETADVAVTVQRSGQLYDLTIDLTIYPTGGTDPIPLVLGVNAITVELLSEGT